MNLVATRWWSMLFMASSLLMLGIAEGAAWCLWAWRRGKMPTQAWPAVALLIDSTVLLYLASTPLVARWAAWTLERENPPVAVDQLPTADAIVVLGGAMYATARADGSAHLYARQASDRFETALAAYQAGRAPVIVFGGGETGVPGTPTEGRWNRARAIERGVAERLRERGARTIIVCSSAMHLPRAAEHYRGLGFTVIPLPSDFATRGAAEEWSWALLIPRGMALA
ncbi:MAG: hypothetical protein RJA05_933 [Planctomycetota bacterium]|jgi:uncharacterized SAM-binding protein YcdF (DUF218 family)